MPRHVAIINYGQALEQLTAFEQRMRAGEKPRDLVPAMATDQIVMLLAAAKQAHRVVAMLEVALTRYLVESRGADPGSMQVSPAPRAAPAGSSATPTKERGA
jgi:hypothetical protein